MNQLTKLFDEKRKRNEKVLSIFLPAGFPKLEMTPLLVQTIVEAGADLVEIGAPFSDPIADGPSIQKASYAALQNGVSLKKILQQIEQMRRTVSIPLILMSYFNPILNHGLTEFCRDAPASGIDGLIIPDLLPEEFMNLRNQFGDAWPSTNFLFAPNTPQDRIAEIDRATGDFLYCVSVTGVTGARSALPPGLIGFLQSVSQKVSHPILVGFGISGAEQAREIANYSEGVIIGSALLNVISRHQLEDEILMAVSRFVAEIKNALIGAWKNGHRRLAQQNR